MKSFSQKVCDVVRKIPKGQTMTYKQVATRAGNVLASRAVGMTLARNTDTTIPCHRVIRSDGKIGGYNGVRNNKKGMESKRDLLISEGAFFKPALGKA